MTLDDEAVQQALSAYAASAPAELSPEDRMAARARGRTLRGRRRWATVAFVALLTGGGVVAVVAPFGSDGVSVLVPAETPEPTPGPPSPSLTPEDAEAFALCRQRFPATVRARADVVATARSPHGPAPVVTSPMPVALAGLSDDSPLAVCLVREPDGGLDSVYGIAEADGRVVLLWRQSGGSDEIVLPI